MSDLLSVPAKKGADTDITRALSNWISSTFGTSENPVDASADVAELQKLRQAAIRPSDRGENAAIASSNYYDHVSALENKVPANEVQIPFKWKDAFDKGSIFGGRISLTVPSFSYEKVCILFNIGAFNSFVAAEQNFESDDGLQKALKRLQLAAGIFNHLKDTVVSAIQREPTPDLEPETLSILSDLMLAQAQEMVVVKAMKDKMKDAIVAKLCSQCEDMYASVMKNIQKEAVRNLWDPDWLQNVSGKQAIYNGLSQFYQSKVCNTDKAVGEEIARLQYAQRLFMAGIERGTHPDLCNAKEWLKRTERALTDAKKDNDFIYHERIPDEKSLKSVAKAAVAKITPMPAKLGTSDKILFDSLVPLAVHQALAAYELRKNDIVNREINNRLKEATNLINASMSSMNLPAALEDTSGNEIPQSLREKSQAVISAGGPNAIKQLIDELPELLTRNTEILDECERLLREELASDEQLKAQFKEKWSRTSSDKLTGTFNTNASKYRTIINNATDADKVVREKFETHREGIDLLAKGSNNMENSLPASAQSQVKSSPAVTKLKQHCEDVETLKAERQVIEAEIKGTNPDMKSIFLNTYAREGSISEQTMSTEALGHAFSSLQNQVSESLKRQEHLLKELMEGNDKFVKESGGQNGSSSRDDMLKKLAAAHDAFFELQTNLQEGTKFYNDLTQLLVTFQNKVSDFCFARKTEKEELMKDLTSGLSQMNMDTTTTPTPPAHHTSGSSASPTRPPRAKDSPARPPPPQVSPPAASAPAPASAPNPYAGAPPGTNPYAGAPPATNPYAGAPPATNPYAGAPPANNPYAGAPPANNPYAGAPNPYAGAPPYPQQPTMPMPYQPYTPMPAGYNPYTAPTGYPQQPYYPPQGGPQPPYGYGYPPQQGGQQPPPGYYPPQGPPPQGPPR